MKKVVVLALAIVGLVACKSKENAPVETVQVKFNVLGLEVTQGVSARRATGDEQNPSKAGLSDLWVMEGTELLCHQDSSMEEFGNPELQLSIGQHTLTFIGSNKSGQQVVGGVWSASSVSNTYGDVVDLNVVSGMAAQSVVMEHVNYLISWQSTDVVVNDAFEAEITISNRRSTLKAGLVGGDALDVYHFSFDPAYYNGQPMNVLVSGFCSAVGVEDSVTTTLLIKNKKAQVMCSYSVRVPVLSNRKTIVKGKMFGGTKSAVMVNSNWMEDYEVEL